VFVGVCACERTFMFVCVYVKGREKWTESVCVFRKRVSWLWAACCCIAACVCARERECVCCFVLCARVRVCIIVCM